MCKCPYLLTFGFKPKKQEKIVKEHNSKTKKYRMKGCVCILLAGICGYMTVFFSQQSFITITPDIIYS